MQRFKNSRIKNKNKISNIKTLFTKSNYISILKTYVVHFQNHDLV